MKRLLLVLLGVGAMTSSVSAQIEYVSQTRTLSAGGTGGGSASAPDFEPFYQAISGSGYGCVTGFYQSSTASHYSILGGSQISYTLHATASGWLGASSQLDVSLLLPAGSGFSLTGQTYFGQGYNAGTAQAVISFVGPGVNITTPTSQSATPVTFDQNYSGIVSGGQYVFSVNTHGGGACAFGHPVYGTGDANGLLRITAPRCRTDVNGNGEVEPDDVAYFVQAWFDSLVQGTFTGDFDGNGLVQPADVAAFIQAWWSAIVDGPC